MDGSLLWMESGAPGVCGIKPVARHATFHLFRMCQFLEEVNCWATLCGGVLKYHEETFEFIYYLCDCFCERGFLNVLPQHSY